MTDAVTALAVRPSTALNGYNPPPDENEFRGMIFMAKQLAMAQGFVPTHFYQQPAKILAAMLYGRDLGITPTNALQHIVVIEGKATADAQLIGMLVRRAGHRLEDKTTDQGSTVTITRGDDGSVHSFTFTMQDAARAGLASKAVWKNYPQAMLYARALTGCARKAAQDALMGTAYTPEELEGGIEPNGEIPALAPGVSEAATGNQTIPTATAIQPTPPAPSEGVPTGAAPTSGNDEPAPAPAPPVANVMPLSGPALGRRMGAGRSISPVRKNVTTVQPPETPATAPEAPPAPAPQPDPVPSQPAPAALTDEPVLPPAPEPEDPGKAIYLNEQRGLLRIQTAELFRVNALLENVKRGLEGKEGVEVPPPTPSPASDQALAQRIDADYPGRTLTNLHQEALEALLQRFEANLQKKREVLKERGISEE